MPIPGLTLACVCALPPPPCFIPLVFFFIRDLKTANVFLNKDNTIKVGDFGISKIMTTRAQAQTVLGTPYYISPEMVRDKAAF
jgi:serine/threonine protein kinase